MRSFDRSVPRFLLAGLANTGAAYATYLLLLHVAPYAVAYTMAYVVGIVVSYLLNAHFVFRRGASWRTFLRFPWIYGVQYLAGMLVVAAGVEWVGLPEWAAPLVALVFTIPLT